MSFNHITLGDVASVKSGYAFKSKDWIKSGVPVIKIKNVKSGWITLEGCSFVTEEVAEKAKNYELKPGEIVISMTGHIGDIAKIRNEGQILLNQRVGRFEIKDTSRLLDDFLFFCLQNPTLRSSFITHAYGVAQPNISPALIEQHQIPLPPLPTQSKIASVLSAYDDLIENNLRRINILEEMAQNLYREWFVKFRFPGHQNARFVDSPLGKIPAGWEVTKLGESCYLTMGQSPKSEFYNDDGIGLPFHQGVTNFGDKYPLDRSYCTVEGRIAEAGDILFSVRAPVGRMNIANKKMVIGRGISAIRHKEGYQSLLWEQLRNRFTEVDMMGNGAIFASVTKSDMQGIELICPPTSIVSDASFHLEPIHNETDVLTNKNTALRRTRDLLLPKLISGEVDVSALDIAIPEEETAT